jgi:isopentenyldiphosphate isomerase
MEIEINKLITITNYAKLKQITRQHVYRLVMSNEITEVKIDEVAFICLDDKALSFERKRVKRKKFQ